MSRFARNPVDARPTSFPRRQGRGSAGFSSAGLLEVACVVLAVLAVGHVAQAGESHWMEGVMLLRVYVILGIAFCFQPG